MKLVLAVVATLAASPVFAQTAPDNSPAPSAPQAASPVEADAQDGGVKALRMTCREDAQAKGLRGMEKRQAVSACVVAKRPDLADREQCRTDGFTKGLRKHELHAFVKECAKAKG